MGAKVIDFYQKQMKRHYNQLINAFREYRFNSNNQIHQTYMQLSIEGNQYCLQYLTRFYEYFEDANRFVENYINKLNQSDQTYEEKIELFNYLLIYYLRYIDALKQGDTYHFRDMIHDLIEKENL